MDIVAITICVNYSDILQHTLIQNAKFFKHWYIVSSPEDDKTALLVSTRKKEYPNLTLLLFTGFYQKGASFDKGSALKFGQTHVYKKHANENNAILILDADIYINDHFQEKIPKQIQINTLYGPKERLDYWKLDDFRHNKYPHIYTHSKEFVGFFQLYSQEPKRFYESWNDCGECDLVFRDLFENKKYLDISVRHLGNDGVHWKGRDYEYGNFNYKGDIFDKNPKFDEKCDRENCYYKKHTSNTNNGGKYCCSSCKHNKQIKHGDMCERRLYSITAITS